MNSPPLPKGLRQWSQEMSDSIDDRREVDGGDHHSDFFTNPLDCVSFEDLSGYALDSRHQSLRCDCQWTGIADC